MKQKHLFFLLSLLLSIGLLSNCERYGNPISDRSDEDSDRPVWAGGDTELNDHINKNETSGDKRGGDYGDLFALFRDINGVPILIQKGEEYFVQPVDTDGDPLELDEEGELVDPTLAIEVDFGRLNIVRSPAKVLESAFLEAMKVIEAGDAFTLDFCSRLSVWNNGVVTKTIDSPRENMALYKEIMTNQFEDRLSILKGSGINPLILASGCFAGGSDKTGTVDKDEVVYINGFIDCIGLYDPILNEHEYDFNHDQKWYFNWGACCDGCEDPVFRYRRGEVFGDREIIFMDYIDGVYYPRDTVFLGQYMETNGLYTNRWEGELDHVEAFATAVDDAVQALDFVHGNSNIFFLAK